MDSLSSSVLLFDVDGVVTDEHARVDTVVVRLILDLVQRGAKVAFITGRSRSWLEGNLMPVIRTLGGEPFSPSFRSAAEMGALRLGRSTGYAWRVSEGHTVSPALRAKVARLPALRRVEHLVEWDQTKEATATIESLHRPDIRGHAEEARAALTALLPECEELAEEHGCRAALSTYALDVLAPSLSKRVGAAFAFGDVGNPEHLSRVLVFGDSAGDLAMAECARAMTAAHVEFFWVGRGTAPAAHGIEVRSSVEPHAPGTAALLRALLVIE